MKRTVLVLSMLLVLLTAVSVSATPITFTGSSGSLAASANFSVVGGNLQVILTNASSADVLNPSGVLTALFFTLTGNPTLTPVSALLSGGSTVFFGPNGGGNVGGEWAYANGLAGAPGGADEGISSAGFNLFGAANFGGANLDGPAAVNGLNYGLLSAGDNTANGNAAVTGQFPLIKNQVTFTLTGLVVGFDPSTGITNVSFQYGTALTEPNVPPTGTPIPEPTTLLLLGSGLIGLAGYGRKKFLRKEIK